MFVSVYFPLFNCNWRICHHVHKVSASYSPFLSKLPNVYFSGFIFFSSVYYIPQFLQVALGDTPVRAGVYLIPLLVGQMAASWLAVRHILPTLKSSHKCIYREWRLVQQEDTR
jgi:hypothetical protein